MKYVVKLLELFIRSTPYSPFTPESGEGGWYSAIVRLTQTGETMLIVNFVPKVCRGGRAAGTLPLSASPKPGIHDT
jgi:hypothetical protein